MLRRCNTEVPPDKSFALLVPCILWRSKTVVAVPTVRRVHIYLSTTLKSARCSWYVCGLAKWMKHGRPLLDTDYSMLVNGI